MLLGLIAAIALDAPVGTPAKVTAASLFKNGYAVVIREMPVNGTGELTLTDIPQGSLGTFWITASEGVKIDSVIATNFETTTTVNAASLDELLTQNVGKQLYFLLHEDGAQARNLQGKLISATGQLVVIEGDTTLAIPKADIASVTAKNGELIYSRTEKGSQRALKFKLHSPGAGKIFLVSLERGMTWVPAYAVDISDEKKLSLVAKATVMDDLADFDGIEARFITGFPSVPWATLQEPLLSGQSVDQFTQFLASVGIPGGGGGFGARRDIMSQNAAPSAEAKDMESAFTPSSLPGVQAEDLFFYRQPDVRLKKGDRAYYILFRADSDYEHLYTWDIDDYIVNNVEYRPAPDGPGDVWHSLKFKNTSGQPLTTAPATVFKDGQIVGQDTMHYTSNGAEVLLKMSKALDIRADESEEEVTRERGVLKIQGYQPYDLVTLKGTLVVKNRKPEKVKMKITKELTGEVVTTDGSPKVTKTAKGLREINPRERLEWTPKIEGGKSLTLTYTYKLYVRGG